MGFPKARKGYDPAVMGSCRSNEELNHRKAEELREYVAAVEPGALYIHHEDFGGFEGHRRRGCSGASSAGADGRMTRLQRRMEAPARSRTVIPNWQRQPAASATRRRALTAAATLA